MDTAAALEDTRMPARYLMDGACKGGMTYSAIIDGGWQAAYEEKLICK